MSHLRIIVRRWVYLLALVACGPSVHSSGQSTPLYANQPITRFAISQSRAENAYDAVKLLQPQWFSGYRAHTHDPTRPPLLVYMNHVRLGDIDELRRLPAENINEIQLLSGIEATTRWGSGHEGGVIHVLTIR